MSAACPRFGFLNGLATISTFLAPAVALGLVLFFDITFPTVTLICLAIGVRLLGDWLFWFQMLPAEIDADKNRRLLFKGIVSSEIKPLLDLLIDSIADVLLVYLALKASIPLVWIIFALIGCQAVGTLIQGIILERVNRMKYHLFSMGITASVFVAALGINGYLFRFDYLSILTFMILYAAKYLFCGTAILAKVAIAEKMRLVMMGVKGR
jgi:hypothetical protein